MRKNRSDSILLNLPEEQQAQLAEWLLSGVPYHKAKELLEKEFSVSFSSLSVFKPFWEQVCVPALLARRSRAVQTADEVSTAAKSRPGQLDAATVDALKQKAFELAISPGADPDAVKSVFSLVLKARDQDLDAEKLKLDWEKFTFDAAKAAIEHAQKIKTISADSQLNTDQKISKVVELVFGRKPGS
ncbi:MAG TPA: hypothetical protein VM680_18555 [Verrucomicrobiae bacterium]|nr:hypothetical protein [Verrucomicrobiae bacterium]